MSVISMAANFYTWDMILEHMQAVKQPTNMNLGRNFAIETPRTICKVGWAFQAI
jgi:hypothetical protein